jgi:hypothetical protein
MNEYKTGRSIAEKAFEWWSSKKGKISENEIFDEFGEYQKVYFMVGIVVNSIKGNIPIKLSEKTPSDLDEFGKGVYDFLNEKISPTKQNKC